MNRTQVKVEEHGDRTTVLWTEGTVRFQAERVEANWWLVGSNQDPEPGPASEQEERWLDRIVGESRDRASGVFAFFTHGIFVEEGRMQGVARGSAVSLGPAIAYGFRKGSTHGFSDLVPDPSEKDSGVPGRVWLLPWESMSRLDSIESFPRWYGRALIQVALRGEDGSLVEREAWAYYTAVAEKDHDCQENAVPYVSDGALGHGWECGVCGEFLQAG